MTKERKEIKEQIEEVYFSEYDIDEILENLQNLKLKYREKYTELKVKEYWDDSWVEYKSFYLYGTRLENDKEYEKRLKKEEKEKKLKEEKEKEQLRKLVKKYPKEISK